MVGVGLTFLNPAPHPAMAATDHPNLKQDFTLPQPTRTYFLLGSINSISEFIIRPRTEGRFGRFKVVSMVSNTQP